MGVSLGARQWNSHSSQPVKAPVATIGISGTEIATANPFKTLTNPKTFFLADYALMCKCSKRRGLFHGRRHPTAGSIHPADAETHPDANVLTRAVGAEEQLVVDSIIFPIEPGDRFLLSGFGVGLSWGSCLLDLDNCHISALVEL